MQQQQQSAAKAESQNAEILNEVLQKSVDKIGLLETIEQSISGGKYFELHNFDGGTMDVLRLKSKCKLLANRKASDNEGKQISFTRWYIWGGEQVAADGEVKVSTRLALVSEDGELLVTGSQFAIKDFIGIISELGLGKIDEPISVRLLGIDSKNGTCHRFEVL